MTSRIFRKLNRRLDIPSNDSNLIQRTGVSFQFSHKNASRSLHAKRTEIKKEIASSNLIMIHAIWNCATRECIVVLHVLIRTQKWYFETFLNKCWAKYNFTRVIFEVITTIDSEFLSSKKCKKESKKVINHRTKNAWRRKHFKRRKAEKTSSPSGRNHVSKNTFLFCGNWHLMTTWSYQLPFRCQMLDRGLLFGYL